MSLKYAALKSLNVLIMVFYTASFYIQMVRFTETRAHCYHNIRLLLTEIPVTR